MNKGVLQGKIFDEVKFQRLYSENEEEYLDFLVLAYKGQFNSKRFQDREIIRRTLHWEYIDNPKIKKETPFIWLCRCEGRIIGQICIMPVDLKIKSNIYKAGWFQNFIILPQYRQKGVGYALVLSVLKEMESVLDVIMAAGTNTRSYRIFKKAGFKDMGFISRNIFALNFKNLSEALTDKVYLRPFLRITTDMFFNFLQFFKRPYRKIDAEVLELGDFTGQLDSFWLDVAKQFPCIVRRDEESLQWRFRLQPDYKYKIYAVRIQGSLRGYIVLKEEAFVSDRLRGLKIGMISDALFNPEESGIGDTLFNIAIDYFKNKVDLIRCDILNPYIEYRIRSTGFIKIMSNNRFLCCLLNKGLQKFESRMIRNKKSWYLTSADSDLELY